MDTGMKLNDLFHHPQVINLAHRSDRRRQVNAQLKRAGVQAGFFLAQRMTEAGDWPSAGARGCFDSHFRILEQALSANEPNVLLIEDDLEFAPDFRAVEELVMAQIAEADWDICYLGHLFADESTPPHALERTDEPVMTTYFYAVNGRILPRLVEFLRQVRERPAGHPLGGPQHVDGALTMFRQQNPDVCTLLVKPRLGIQSASRSDVNAAWYDQLPLAGALINFARRCRRKLSLAA